MYDINKLKKPVNGNIPGMNGKTSLTEADTLLVRGTACVVIVTSPTSEVVGWRG